MVYLFSRHDNPTLKTQFTEGMLHSIFVTDPLPRTTVSLLRRLIPAILLIITVHLLLMLRTVTTVCKVRTARICAWSFRSPWHNHHLQYKSPARIAPSGLRSFYFRHYNYITGAISHSITSTLIFIKSLQICKSGIDALKRCFLIQCSMFIARNRLLRLAPHPRISPPKQCPRLFGFF